MTSRAPTAIALIVSIALLALFAACEPSLPPPPPPPPSPTMPVASSAVRPGAADACLSIAGWNDLHGQIEPEDAQIDATRVPAGGVIALADRLAALRATGDVVVALDAGDLFTGPLASTLAEGAPIIDAYNAMQVDVAAIGNHEFDFGPVGYARVTAPLGVRDDAGADGPRGALFARMASAQFPFVSANLRRADGTPLDVDAGWKPLRRSTHVLRGGYDVGVVGYSTLETPLTTLRANVVGLDFATNAAANVAREIHALRASGASPIVLLAHASLDGTLPQLLDDPADPEGGKRTGELALLVDALPLGDRPDVIIGGHRHQWMLGRVRGIPIVSSDCHGIGLARIRFCRPSTGTPPRLDRIERQVAMALSQPSSPLGVAVASAVAPWQAKVQAEADALVTTLTQPCPDKALNGTALAEQTARALVEHVGAAETPPRGMPVVGLVNSGALRAPLGAGPVHYRDLFATSPFENGVAVCVTTRAGVARTVTRSVAALESHERLTFGLAGAKVTLQRAVDGGLTLKRLVLDPPVPTGRPARDDDPVWLVVPDFIASGGDALFDASTCTRVVLSPLRVRDAWRELLARERTCNGPPRNVVIEGP